MALSSGNIPTLAQDEAAANGWSRGQWLIVAALFVATTLNYADRQVLGLLAETLQHRFLWTEAQYGYVVTGFTVAYSIGLLSFGPFIDRVGTRLGYALSVGCWSIASACHALAGSILGFGVARFLLGLAEAGNFPAAIRTVSEWFPRKDRALAIGIFNSGSNVGAILVPLIVPWIVLRYGWRAAFLVTPAVGLVWAALWFRFYRRPSASPEVQTELPDADASASPSVPWLSALRYRQTWGLCLARFLTDPVWWFYLYWIPKYLFARRGITLQHIGLPLIIIYLAADAGSIAGGWFSSALIKRNVSVNRARKLAILVFALLVVPLAFSANLDRTWKVVVVLGMATAGHQGWAANMFATISDIYPQRMVGSITGLAGFAGSLGGILAASAIGLFLQRTGSYTPIFVYAGFSYLLILGIWQVLIPRIEPIKISASGTA